MTMPTIKVTAKEYRVIKDDLTRAKKYLAFHEREEQNPREASMREALTLAAIVAYNRPFTACTRLNEKKRKPWIPASVVDGLPSDLKFIHDDLVEQRNKMWAHTDENHIDERPLGARPLIKSYPKAMIPEFRRLIETVIDSIESSS